MNVGEVIVDTNVPIVADGQSAGVCAKCRIATIDFLELLFHKGTLIIDLEGAVEEEYRKNLRGFFPGVGSRLLQHFFINSAHRVRRVSIGPDSNGKFAGITFAGTLKNFDLSDRKFAALSVVTSAPVCVSVDSDWAISKDALAAAGVKIDFLCGENQTDWYD